MFTRIFLALFGGLFLAALGALSAVGILFATGLLKNSSSNDLEKNQQKIVSLFEELAPAVVFIAPARSDKKHEFVGEEVQPPENTGSGFLWDTAGHIVTNEHVVRDGNSFTVKFSSGLSAPARVIGRAPNFDLAVLKISVGRDIAKPIPIGSTNDLKVGQSVIAIGNPFGLNQTLTTGVVSALGRRFTIEPGREIANLVQTDAAINPGNSGGPLIDISGKLVGVNTAIVSPSGTSAGIGFAIPAETVSRVIPKLIRDGRIPTPSLGLVIADEQFAAQYGIEGLLVLRTLPESAARKAGLKGVMDGTGNADIIVAADNIRVYSLADLIRVLNDKEIGSKITLNVARSGGNVRFELEVQDAN